MSNYVQVLRRLEQGKEAVLQAPARLERPHPEEDQARPAAHAPRRVAAAPAVAANGRLSAACAPLLERLRAMAAESALRSLVFACVSESSAARDLLCGLAARGSELGLEIALGSLARAGGRPILEERCADGSGEPRSHRPVELDASSRAESAARWIEQFPLAQLILVDGPALDSSVDALLLGAAFDGLVIAAEAGSTQRAALRAAVERARAAGCRVHGVVLLEPR